MLKYTNSNKNNKQSKVVMNDSSTTKSFDSSSKVLNANGTVATNTSEQRKELVENLLMLLQNSMDQKIGSVPYSQKVDSLENHLFEITTYMSSLKEACETIATSFPTTEEKDLPLQEVIDTCTITNEGVENVKSYLAVIKQFSQDLINIKTELYTQVQYLFQEV